MFLNVNNIATDFNDEVMYKSVSDYFYKVIYVVVIVDKLSK